MKVQIPDPPTVGGRVSVKVGMILKVEPRYLIVTLGRLDNRLGICCRKCSMVSFNTNDLTARYCGCCHEFLDERLAPSIEQMVDDPNVTAEQLVDAAFQEFERAGGR
jgi:hypothetical protein